MMTEAYREAWGSYREAIASIYRQDLRALVATSGPTEPEVLEGDPVDRALGSSQRLAAALAERLDSGEEAERRLATIQLAAAASVDLGVAADLARRSDEVETAEAGMAVESLSFALPDAVPVLDAEVLPEALAGEWLAFEGPSPSAEDLANEVEVVIGEIKSQVAEAGGAAVEGLVNVAVPAGEGLEAVARGLLGLLGEDVGRAVRRVVSFAVKGIEKLLRLLGAGLAEKVAVRLDDWLDGLRRGEAWDAVLTRLWETRRIEAETTQRVAAALLTEERAREAAERLQTLGKAHRKQAGLVRKALRFVNFVGPAAAGLAPPAGPLILGGGYAAAVTFLLLGGADYVDWYRLEDVPALDRIDGVRHIVEAAVIP